MTITYLFSQLTSDSRGWIAEQISRGQAETIARSEAVHARKIRQAASRTILYGCHHQTGTSSRGVHAACSRKFARISGAYFGNFNG